MTYLILYLNDKYPKMQQDKEIKKKMMSMTTEQVSISHESFRGDYKNFVGKDFREKDTLYSSGT
jgi:hypothetical protein